jgi:GST-like protein
VDKRYVVYGQKGTGSVPVEATLLLLGEPYEVIERGPSEDRPAGNPMQQVPVLALPNGELMTESAAILIHLADSHPAARMSPALIRRRQSWRRWPGAWIRTRGCWSSGPSGSVEGRVAG